MLERRSFLRGLVSLPLIGGSVALIGQPTAAAVPVTERLKDRYIAWLGNEYAAALFERDVEAYKDCADQRRMNTDWRFTRTRMPLFNFAEVPDIERLTAWTLPSGRAAVVLSAVGCSLGGVR